MLRRVPLPTWIFLLALVAFVATWILAPRSSLSGQLPPVIPLPHRAAHASPTSALPLFAGSGRPLGGRVVGRPNQVAFTFDDGPHHLYTARLLAILAEHHAPAAFFVNGRWLHGRHGAVSREILQAAHRAGHIIGNHTYSHVNLTRLPKEEQTEEILRNDRAILEVVGERPLFFRPPYAVISRHALQILREHGYVEARWNAAAPDEELRQPEEIRDSVMGWLRHHQGGIVMLHDRNRATVEGMRLILAAIARENRERAATGEPIFQLVPLDSFLRSPAKSGVSTGFP